MRLSLRTRSQLKAALAEDVGRKDLTSEIFIPRRAGAEAYVFTREAGIFCGEPLARELARIADPALRLKFSVKDGARIRKNQKLLEIRGNTRSILALERTLLNFLGRLSGIATLTRRFVERVKPYRVLILDTRKTTPLWRELEKYAVRAGGGKNHRFGLWDEILVKDNHWAAMWDLLNETKCRYFMKRLRPALKQRRVPVEIEVKSLKELIHLLEGNYAPDRILLDTFSVRNLRRAVRLVRRIFSRRKNVGADLRARPQGAHRGAPLLEASGGVTLENVRAVAATGVDRISIGRLTHSPPALDFSLQI